MSNHDVLTKPEGGIGRGRVVSTLSSGKVVIATEGDPRTVECDLLVGAVSGRRALAPGAPVLAWLPAEEDQPGVIVGEIAPQPSADPPDTLIIEAERNLTLRVGDGSITIRQDGKILIKGTHLVSHAKKINRIRGGSVAIN